MLVTLDFRKYGSKVAKALIAVRQAVKKHKDSSGLLIEFLDEHCGISGGIILPLASKLEKLVKLEKSRMLERALQVRFPGHEHVRGSLQMTYISGEDADSGRVEGRPTLFVHDVDAGDPELWRSVAMMRW